MGLKGLDTKAKRRHFWRLTKKFHHLKINSLLLDLMMSCSEHPMDFELRFTDKEIPARGGMSLMKRMLDRMQCDAALSIAGLPQPDGNRGYAPEQLITQFMLSVWCGANRFEHGEVTRHDPVLKRIFGIKRMANFKAVMRVFRRFTQHSNEAVMDKLYGWMFEQIAIEGITLDVDSTVMTRYGQQDGAARGYNPA